MMDRKPKTAPNVGHAGVSEWERAAWDLRSVYERHYGCNINMDTGDCRTHTACRYGRIIALIWKQRGR